MKSGATSSQQPIGKSSQGSLNRPQSKTSNAAIQKPLKSSEIGNQMSKNVTKEHVATIQNVVEEVENDEILERELNDVYYSSRAYSDGSTEVNEKEQLGSEKQNSRYPSKRLALKIQKENHKKALSEITSHSVSEKKSSVNEQDLNDSDANYSSGLEEDYSDLIADGIVPKAANKRKTKRASWKVVPQNPLTSEPEPNIEQNITISVCSRCANLIGKYDSLTLGRLEESKEERRTLTPQSSVEKVDNDDSAVYDQNSDSMRGFKWKLASNDSDTESVTNFLARKQQFFKTASTLDSHRNDTYR